VATATIDRSLIKALPIFQKMSDSELDDVLSRASSRRYPQGEAVFEQGAPATTFFVLLHGRLKVTQLTADGQQVIVRMVNPGDLFGIARTISSTPTPPLPSTP
jgi:CRP-like cAMP-binding protein